MSEKLFLFCPFLTYLKNYRFDFVLSDHCLSIYFLELIYQLFLSNLKMLFFLLLMDLELSQTLLFLSHPILIHLLE